MAERAIIRILDDGRAAGAGILVAPDVALTCRHVVDARLGAADVELDAAVEVDFPLLGGGPRAASVCYLPEQPELDLVGLRLDPHPEARPARVVDVDDVVGRRVSAFGFDARRPRGAWAKGVLRGRTADGRLQMDDERAQGVSVSQGFSGGPVVDDDLGAIVGVTVEVESRPERRTSYALSGRALHDAWPLLGEAATQSNPFRGLEPFREGDSELFFGRARDAAELVTRLDPTGVLTVTGPSGCGKSSLALAGLFPRLGTEGTFSIGFRPAATSNPWNALAVALDEDVADLRDGRLADVTNRVLVRRSLRRLVILVDQLDEGLVRHPADTRDLLDALLEVATSQRREPRVDLVVTVNAQHLDDLLGDSRFSRRLNDSVHLLGVPNAGELREIVEGPLAPVGMPIYQEGLPELLLDDVADQRNPLPLLEFALTSLWDRQERGVLTHDAYRDFDGVAGAVSAYAEQVWRTVATDEDSEQQLRWLFCQLVSPLPDGGWTRHVVPLADLGDDAEVATRLAGTRLVTLATAADGAPTVELAHESLVRLWPRFRGWAEEERDFRAEQDELDRRIDRWEQRRDKSLLLRGQSLRRAIRWDHDTLTERQRAFVVRSVQAAANRWGWRSAVALLLVGIVATSLAFAGNVRREQEHRDEVSAAAALLGTETHTTQADLAVALRALRTADAPSTRAAVQAWYRTMRHATIVLPWFTNSPSGGTLTPDGAFAAVFDDDLERLDVYDLTRSPPSVRSVDLPRLPQRFVSAWVAPHHLALRDQEGIGIWDLSNGRQVQHLDGAPDEMLADRSGRWLGWGTIGSVEYQMVDLATPGAPTTQVELPGGLGFIDQGGEGVVVLQVLPEGTVRVDQGDPDHPKVVVSTAGIRDASAAEGDLPDYYSMENADLATSADGQLTTVSCEPGAGMQLRRFPTGEVLATQPLTGTCGGDETGSPVVATFSADAQHVAVLDDGPAQDGDMTLGVGPVGSPALLPVEVPAGFRPIQLAADGAGTYTIAIRGADGLVVLRFSPDPLDAALNTASDGIVTPDGRYLVLRFTNQALEVWDTSTRQRVARSTTVLADHPTSAIDLYGTYQRSEDYLPGYTPELRASPDSALLAVSHHELPTVKVLRLPDLDAVGTITAPLNDPPLRDIPATAVLDFAADHRLLVKSDEAYTVWSAEGEQLADPIALPLDGQQAGAGQPLLLPDRDEFVAVEFLELRRYRLAEGTRVEDGTIRFETGDREPTSTADTTTTRQALDDDGDRLAVALVGGVEVWDLESGEREARYELPDDTVATTLRFGTDEKVLEIQLQSSRDAAPLGVLVWRWDRNAGLARYYGGFIRRPDQTSEMAGTPASGGWDLAAGGRVEFPGDVLDLQSTDPEVWVDQLCALVVASGIDETPESLGNLPDGAYGGALCPDH